MCLIYKQVKLSYDLTLRQAFKLFRRPERLCGIEGIRWDFWFYSIMLITANLKSFTTVFS